MPRYNHCEFIGHLGRDPELREHDGTPVANFSIAVNKYRDEDDPMWVNVSAWGKQGEACAKYLEKGRPVLVAGELDVREYEGREGDTRYSVDLRASRVVFLGKGQREEMPEGAESFTKPRKAARDEEIPF